MTIRRHKLAAIKPGRAADRFFSGTISLVDVRGEREHRAVQIPCATHIPLPQLRGRVSEIRSDRPVAFMCRSGHRSVLATRIARRHGLDAMSVAGGMHAWLAEGLPAAWPRDVTLEKHSGAPPGKSAARARDSASVDLGREPRRERVQMTPTALDDPGLVLVDATWGTIQPMSIALGVETIGELELIEHLRAGRQLIDTRREEFVADGTIPGAVAIAHTEIEERLEELDPARPIAMFCNGPQCAATPDAVRRLVAAGRPPALIRYYRGGMHDWMTLGLPVRRGDAG